MNLRRLAALVLFRVLGLAFAPSHLLLAQPAPAKEPGPSSAGWITNGPAVFHTSAFEGFSPASLNNLVWTNLLAHTNGRTMVIWSERVHPPDWPASPPKVQWDTSGLMWGMKGETALSPCWEGELISGQIPVTLLTRRHGYTRGHSMGEDGFSTRYAGKKVWFVTRDNRLVQVKIVRQVVRTMAGSGRDYTIFLFDRDLPATLEPLRVVSPADLLAHDPPVPQAPWVTFLVEQTGKVSAGLPGFSFPAYKGGDSGAPNLLPLPGELVFYGGRTTSGPSAQMQADMDELCRLARLKPSKYQMQRVSLEGFLRY